MHCDAIDPDRLPRAALLIHLNSLDLGQSPHTVVAYELPKNSVEPIQVGCLVKENEELAPVGARPLVRHGDDATGVVLQGGTDLVLESTTPDGLAAFGVAGRRVGWTSCLHHE